MSTQQPDIFINGKAQIFEMLRFMDPLHRKTLLKNIQIRNPRLANEFIAHCITFETFLNLSDGDISTVIHTLPSSIIGMALKNTTNNNQKKILELMNRKSAEEAFEIMTQNISNEKSNSIKAQNKVVNTMINLYQTKVISIFSN